MMSGSIPNPIEYRVIWPDGSIHIVSDEAGEFILDEDGKPSIVAGIVTGYHRAQKSRKRFAGKRTGFGKCAKDCPFGQLGLESADK